jgi:tRNA(Ile)-lysidine synthase
VIERVRKYVLNHGLLTAGERVAIAVSAGADSVALLRILLELRTELGIVISVAHFHHGIRGSEADADQQFVAELSHSFELPFHFGSGEAPAHARKYGLSLETAARDLRHQWFTKLLAEGRADKIATAHTLDDQAETVLMRVLRGAGAKGLAGISPLHTEKRLIRPLLEISRKEIEEYLRKLKQPWREDSSNQDLAHTRNRVRHQLVPLLEQQFNPGIRQTLADLAELAQAEAEYWEGEVAAILSRVLHSGKPSRSGRSNSGSASGTLALDLANMKALPLAIQRQVLHQVACCIGITLEFKHIQQLTDSIRDPKPGRRIVLPGAATAITTYRELQFSRDSGAEPARDYSFSLQVPGEVVITALGSTIRARLIRAVESDLSGYNPALLLDRALLQSELIVRNWRAGDRFFPAHSRSPKKVKELLQSGRLGRPLAPSERLSWPVIESAGQIVWVRGFFVSETFSYRAGDAVLIEEIQTISGVE